MVQIVKKIQNALKWSISAYPDNFQLVWKLSIMSGKLPGCLEIFQIIEAFFQFLGRFPDSLKQCQADNAKKNKLRLF